MGNDKNIYAVNPLKDKDRTFADYDTDKKQQAPRETRSLLYIYRAIRGAD